MSCNYCKNKRPWIVLQISIPSKWTQRTAADPLQGPPENPRKADRGYCGSISQKAHLASPFELSGTAQRGCPGQGKAFGWPLAVCPPERPRPFTHYRKNWFNRNSDRENCNSQTLGVDFIRMGHACVANGSDVEFSATAYHPGLILPPAPTPSQGSYFGPLELDSE